ncbi:hypothetical protein A0256_21760 [Mucilaginibacter sp. PAMC 26640]|nr:hypothetical protein A0256_21760 [Mucilaginibacter sp. PAMC 26640]
MLSRKYINLMKFTLSGTLLAKIKRFKAMAIITALALSSQLVAAQSVYNISGTVKDEKNKELPSVTVFLSGRTNITASNEKGVFTFYNLPPGSYLLVARSVGYKTYAKEITVTAADVKINVKLKQQLNTLHEVVVNGFLQKYFDKFSRYFLGTTPNSEKCTILNRDALHFYFDKETQTLSVSADELLQIQNDALGYKISYSLESFELNEEKHLLKYQGYPSFQ